MSSEIRVQLDGQEYLWDERGWVLVATNEEPPTIIVERLDAMAAPRLAASDASLVTEEALIRAAHVADKSNQYARAARLFARALSEYPKSYIASMYCSLLRRMGKAEVAVQVADRFARCDNAPLLTTKAAALCDLGRYEEALRVVRQALALDPHHDAFRVQSRIKSVRPDLFR